MAQPEADNTLEILLKTSKIISCTHKEIVAGNVVLGKTQIDVDNLRHFIINRQELTKKS